MSLGSFKLKHKGDIITRSLERMRLKTRNYGEDLKNKNSHLFIVCEDS